MAQEYAILSTFDGEIQTVEAHSWGDALAQFLGDYDSLLVTQDHEPNLHYTADIYTGDDEERAIVMLLDDLEVDDPKSFPPSTK
jgi:hypothetical protein